MKFGWLTMTVFMAAGLPAFSRPSLAVCTQHLEIKQKQIELAALAVATWEC
jgi:uncharacterized membrane protein